MVLQTPQAGVYSILFSDNTECYLSQEAVSTVEILLNAGLNSSDKSLMLEGGNIF